MHNNKWRRNFFNIFFIFFYKTNIFYDQKLFSIYIKVHLNAD